MQYRQLGGARNGQAAESACWRERRGGDDHTAHNGTPRVMVLAADAVRVRRLFWDSGVARERVPLGIMSR